MRNWMRWIAAAGLMLLPGIGTAQAPAAAPTTQAAARSDRQASIRRWLGDLADEDDRVRDASRRNLMALKRGDLPALKAAVMELAPLAPSQLAALRDIVTQAYLSGDNYARDLRMGFMGVRLSADREAEVGGDGPAVIESRLPGFCGYAALRDGDVIVKIVGRDLPEPLTRSSFIDAVQTTPAGRTLTLRVLRGGKEIEVPVTLDARPVDETDGTPMLTDPQMDELIHRRSAEAETYWQAEFAQVVRGR